MSGRSTQSLDRRNNMRVRQELFLARRQTGTTDGHAKEHDAVITKRPRLVQPQPNWDCKWHALNAVLNKNARCSQQREAASKAKCTTYFCAFNCHCRNPIAYRATWPRLVPLSLVQGATPFQG
jgi:hypothetical protein